jgi:hypothetical protein
MAVGVVEGAVGAEEEAEAAEKNALNWSHIGQKDNYQASQLYCCNDGLSVTKQLYVSVTRWGTLL